MSEATDRAATEKPAMHPMLKLVLEFGPLLAFFFANARGGWLADRFPQLAELGGPIFIATAVFMVVTVIALSVSWLVARHIPLMPLVSGVIVIVFGALTLWLQDELFIKIKPTIINTMFGTVLLVGLFVFRVSLLRYVFDTAFKIDDRGWYKLTVRWGLFLLFLAILNEVIWRSFSTDFWVAFKVWGMTPITLAFTLSQMPLLMRHSLEEE
ncbi:MULTISPECIES: septation protein A [unclassified Roseitalea]|uniref:septation protein A n=1 Tax=unclassified Roseitalea TaxID=2639107 RepID=UPI0027400A4F|nr:MULTISPECIES: septation protein A [unclassified Roseitalea]